MPIVRDKNVAHVEYYTDYNYLIVKALHSMKPMHEESKTNMMHYGIYSNHTFVTSTAGYCQEMFLPNIQIVVYGFSKKAFMCFTGTAEYLQLR